MTIYDLDIYVSKSVARNTKGDKDVADEFISWFETNLASKVQKGECSVLAIDMLAVTKKALYRLINDDRKSRWKTDRLVEEYMFMLITQHTLNGCSIVATDVDRVRKHYRFN